VISTLRDSTAHVFVDAIDTPILDELDAHHLLRVLRVTTSDPVTVSDGKGNWRSCRVGADATVEVTSETFVQAQPISKLTVAFSLVKGDRPEWTVQKLTEIGIDEIILLAATSRSVVRWDKDRAGKNISRLRRVAREAAMQSRRTWLPNVRDVTEMSAIPELFIADPNGAPLDATHCTIAIGPEGGFSEQESGVGAGLVSLGDTVLRAETAAISAAVLMSDHRRKRNQL
jgi:16S rRNA (uracil1498-N3)-methyltransferase